MGRGLTSRKSFSVNSSPKSPKSFSANHSKRLSSAAWISNPRPLLVTLSLSLLSLSALISLAQECSRTSPMNPMKPLSPMTLKTNSWPSPLTSTFFKLNYGKILDEIASNLYLIGKPHVSSFQRIKRFAIWSLLEEVMRKLLKAVQGWQNAAKFS